jgi:AcrR family transcriptional regulator
MPTKSMSRRPRRVISRKGEARRQQILATAKSLLMKGGPDAVVLRDVAERLGITHGNLQYYYPTRHDLLVAIFDQEVAKYTDGVKNAVAATTTRRGRLAAVIDSGLTLIRSPETALWRQMVGMVDHSPGMAALHKKELQAYEDALAKELKVIAPRLTPPRRRHIAKTIQAIVDGLSIQYVHEDPESPEIRAMESEIKAAIFALIEAD